MNSDALYLIELLTVLSTHLPSNLKNARRTKSHRRSSVFSLFPPPFSHGRNPLNIKGTSSWSAALAKPLGIIACLFGELKYRQSKAQRWLIFAGFSERLPHFVVYEMPVICSGLGTRFPHHSDFFASFFQFFDRKPSSPEASEVWHRRPRVCYLSG